jgi:hypothetical protein
VAERTASDNREDIKSLRLELREANFSLKEAVVEFAKANAAYRLAKAKAFLRATGTVAEKTAHVDEDCNELLFQRDLTEGKKEAATELVRSLRSELSAAQTESNSLNVEMEFSKTMVPLDAVMEHLDKLAQRRERKEREAGAAA